MKYKQDEWFRLSEKARWYELPQRSVGLGAVLGLTVACVGLLIMLIQFFFRMPFLIFGWGLAALMTGCGLFAYAERAQILHSAWRPERERLIEQRAKSQPCMHLEGDLPTHLRDQRQAHCAYYEKTFQHAPLCIYCESYSPSPAKAEAPVPQAAPVAEVAYAASAAQRAA